MERVSQTMYVLMHCWSPSMKSNNDGFLMTEFLVYFFLGTCLSYCVVHFIVASSLHMCREHKKIGAITELLTALDYCGYTLENAPCDKKLWKKMEPKLLIWHDAHDTIDIGLRLAHDKLVRIKGTYSLFKKSWISKKKAILARNIKDVEFTWHEDSVASKKNIRYISCQLKRVLPDKDDDYSVCKSVALENRILV